MEQLTREQQLILIVLIGAVVIGVGVNLWRQNVVQKPVVITSTQPRNVLVQISGGVNKPGLYRVKAGDRVAEVIALAGGVLPAADLFKINLAAPVKDGEEIIIPLKQLISLSSSPGPKPINLNTASEHELDKLPGIGPATARAIICYRLAKGPFKKREQLLEIKRFGKARLKKIYEQISI
ncbi:hypothetical protein A2311_02215 [candidate division WOR-1 bacterium RIFOXYB2_FULL_48_7]|uniref:Helix-hairpin-helix DNA-binding motif class 1 domain-containing protein n=1 Tax=candidate division WOR-1 bacterium RIFOXYB2_FULL_48_7 TaxID=1802583 RepID=A0A1F4TVC1_UNCSA|nr:MAG: hypothetical protein A2311_02215 [candidate division WOR-1 bacterium RIFOXYB2_FULL_48_7]